MRSILSTSSIRYVSAGALVAALGLSACQPSQPAGPKAASEPTSVAAVTAPTEAGLTPASSPPEVAPEAPAQDTAPAASAKAQSESVEAPTAPASAVKVNVPAQQTPPPSAAKPAIQPGVLPAGAGRNVAQRLCGTCHSLVLVTATGHTEAEWDSVVARMEANGMQASADDIDTVISYLAKALPPR